MRLDPKVSWLVTHCWKDNEAEEVIIMRILHDRFGGGAD